MEDVGSEFNQRLHSLEARVADSVLQHAPPVLVTRRKQTSFLHDKPGEWWNIYMQGKNFF